MFEAFAVIGLAFVPGQDRKPKCKKIIDCDSSYAADSLKLYEAISFGGRFTSPMIRRGLFL